MGRNQLVAIALFQIILIISIEFIIPISYRSYLDGIGPGAGGAGEGKESSWLNEKVSLLGELFTNFMPSVAAQEPQLYCCERTKEGAICQTAGQEQCNPSFRSAAGKCEDGALATCVLGCCLKNGVASESVPALTCQQAGGDFFSGKSCDEVPQAIKGCCAIGDQYSFTTESRCNILAKTSGIQANFRLDIQSEATCLALKFEDAEGCCETNGRFQFGTQRACTEKRGTFNEGKLCSNPDLVAGGSTCVRQKSTGCADGLDGVYWYDSCGNRENIYDTNRERSWSNGLVLPKAQSCGANTANINSASCGNCNYLSGSVCGRFNSNTSRPSVGDYICKDLFCRNTLESNGVPKIRKSGESWCVYDSETGQGQDVVGSRHWRALCIDGEQIIEPCSDFRQQVCMQGSVDVGGQEYVESACVTNRWRECLNIQDRDVCANNTGCSWFDSPRNWEGFGNNTCVPKTSPGFDISSFIQNEQAPQSPGSGVGRAVGDAAVCNAGSYFCQVKMKKSGLFGGGGCKGNCECTKEEWRNKMNDRCNALGDCGASVNVAGEFTQDGYAIYSKKVSEEFDEQEFFQKAKRIPLKDSYLNSLKRVFILPLEGEGRGITGRVVAITGLDTNLQQMIKDYKNLGGKMGLPAEASGRSAIATETEGFFDKLNIDSDGFSEAAAAVAIFFIAKSFGVSDAIAGVVAVTYLIYPKFFEGIGKEFLSKYVSTGLGGMIVAILIAVILQELFGDIINDIGKALFGEEYTKVVYFSCQAALPPDGGAKCDLCNKDSRRPCSEYRCKSLGATCELMNKGTSQELCVSVAEDDLVSPKIENVRVETAGHEVANLVPGASAKIQKTGGSCLEPFSSVRLSIIANEASQCKFDFEHGTSFDDMTFWLSGTNFYLREHPLTLTPPGNPINGSGTGEFRPGVENTFFIKCKDRNGNKNAEDFTLSFCVDVAPDRTPPRVVETSPISGSFLPFGTTQREVKVYTNEPAACKWNLIDSSYEQMLNRFTCLNKIDEVQSNGAWLCKANMSMQQGENNFYLRCKDNPNGGNGSVQNVNSQSFMYKLTVADELKIASISPSGGEIKLGSRGQPIPLEVQTSGGANNRAYCFYSFTGYGVQENVFSETGGSAHKSLLALEDGQYTFFIRCQDSASNEARAQVSVRVNVDRTAPQLVRVFVTGGSLMIVTDEVSSCRYSDKDFSYADGKVLEPDNSVVHSAPLSQVPATMYLRCRDGFGNEGLRLVRPRD